LRSLLQRIRAEAHRFANEHSALLLRRRMRESMLDDCPGMSPRRKQQVLERFGSVARLRGASVAETAALPGSRPAPRRRSMAEPEINCAHRAQQPLA
jgi:excinuclease ABC subunit C